MFLADELQSVATKLPIARSWFALQTGSRAIVLQTLANADAGPTPRAPIAMNFRPIVGV